MVSPVRCCCPFLLKATKLVSTTFYFIPGVDSGPIVDATAKEERLATARLSVCMNVFEDVCGMQTLGQMDIDPMQLLECTRDALTITK